MPKISECKIWKPGTDQDGMQHCRRVVVGVGVVVVVVGDVVVVGGGGGVDAVCSNPRREEPRRNGRPHHSDSKTNPRRPRWQEIGKPHHPLQGNPWRRSQRDQQFLGVFWGSGEPSSESRQNERRHKMTCSGVLKPPIAVRSKETKWLIDVVNRNHVVVVELMYCCRFVVVVDVGVVAVVGGVGVIVRRILRKLVLYYFIICLFLVFDKTHAREL